VFFCINCPVRVVVVVVIIIIVFLLLLLSLSLLFDFASAAGIIVTEGQEVDRQIFHYPFFFFLLYNVFSPI